MEEWKHHKANGFGEWPVIILRHDLPSISAHCHRVQMRLHSSRAVFPGRSGNREWSQFFRLPRLAGLFEPW